MPSYQTAKDIVIPAGTEVNVAGAGETIRYVSRYAEVTTGVDPNTCHYWRMDLEEAMDFGIVEAVIE